MVNSATNNGAQYQANIPKYFIYTSLKGFNFGLIIATWVIYLQQQHGLSLTQVTFVDVVFWITSTLGEVPTGVVADSYGRKTSLAIGSAIMCISLIAWTLAPNVLVIVVAYALLALGVTFVSGANDAFFFESLKAMGRAGEYTRLAGRVAAISMASGAVGSLASGLLATIDLRLPFAGGAICLFAAFAMVLTFKEPKEDSHLDASGRSSYGAIVRQSLQIMREKPALRYAIFYLTLIPMVAMITETVFLQPQAIALGVPLAGIGVVVLTLQVTRIAASTWSQRIKSAFGFARVIYATPFLIAASLLLIGLFQVLPALFFYAVISFTTAAIRPMVMYVIQSDVTDNIRATVLSMQSLLFAAIIAFVEPALGYVADQAGLPASYYLMAAGIIFFSLMLFWRSRPQFP